MAVEGFEQACARHGAAHTFIHEAGHAVAAADRRVRFHHVRVLPPLEWELTNQGFIAGGLNPGSDAEAWVRSEPRTTFEVVIAGVAAERALLRHSLYEGYVGDLNFWRRHMGLTDALTPVESKSC